MSRTCPAHGRACARRQARAEQWLACRTGKPGLGLATVDSMLEAGKQQPVRQRAALSRPAPCYAGCCTQQQRKGPLHDPAPCVSRPTTAGDAGRSTRSLDSIAQTAATTGQASAGYTVGDAATTHARPPGMVHMYGAPSAGTERPLPHRRSANAELLVTQQALSE